MKLLVTGGLGFIGSNFIISLLNKNNIEILNFDKVTYSANFNNLTSIDSSPNYHFVKGDICNGKTVNNVLSDFKPEAIINFAAESHVDRSIDSPMDFIQTNIIGTVNLLECSLNYYNNIHKEDFKFIHISTDEVYGALDEKGKFTEKTAYSPNSPYSASKASSDHLVRAWNGTFGLPTIITNCSNNYGPYQFPEKLIPLMITKCLNNEKLPVYGDGKNIRDWIYVEDHCDAIYSVLKKGKIGSTYLIGSNNEFSNIDIINKICDLLDSFLPSKKVNSYRDLIEYVQDRAGHDYRYAIDNNKIVNELNWKPKHEFDIGLKNTIKWYLDNREWWESIIDKTYNLERLGVIK